MTTTTLCRHCGTTHREVGLFGETEVPCAESKKKNPQEPLDPNRKGRRVRVEGQPWLCPSCGADCPLGAVMCGVCWRHVPKVKQAVVNAAWKHVSAKGFGDLDAAAAYDAAVDMAAEAAREARKPKPVKERPVRRARRS